MRSFMHLKALSLIILPNVFLAGCWQVQPKSFRQGMKYLQEQNYKAADEEFKKLFVQHSKYAIQAAEQAAAVHFNTTRQYIKALSYYKYVVQFSHDQEKQKKSQQQIAHIYFYKQLSYKKAIQAYSKVLIFNNSLQEVFEARYNMARSYLYLNDFFQAQVEAQELLKQKLSSSESFDVELLVARILSGSQKIEEAVQAYRQLLLQHPKKSIREKVPLSIAVCLEEQKKFAEAIEELEKMKPFYEDTDFIELRIKKLKLHRAHRPKSRRAI